ncbi:uncharacterized protein LOC131940060 isoform X2 [Physella acuta]|uniref:uncharacterized protein LOC131940060 isoform X2 n=1 Tax=Physella acuta TaxID=109671 RepID=UPI0027DD3304|nr:uncharacterized protein LOC131940060 isoform X2 [Physella acuta]
MNWTASEMQRLVTYRDVQSLLESMEIWTLKLAQQGFSYTGQGSKVRCESCGRELDFEEFLTAGTMQEPCLPQFHASGCVYTSRAESGPYSVTWSAHTPGNNHTARDLEVNIPTDHPVIGSMTSLEESTETWSDDVMTTPQDKTPTSPRHVHQENVIVVNSMDTPHDRTERDTPHDRETEEPLDEIQRGASGTEMVMAAGISAGPGNTQEEVNTSRGSTVIRSERKTTETKHLERDLTHIFIDEGVCSPEVAEASDTSSEGEVHRVTCPKNPGHFAYFPVRQLTLEQIPSQTRHPEVLEFLRHWATLTVRISVSHTSQHRSNPRPKGTYFGTGCVLLEPLESFTGPANDKLHATETSKKSWMSFLKKNKEFVYIVTSTHLVFDDEEAVHAHVEFFFEHPNRKNVKIIKGNSVIPSPIFGDYRCILVCKTSDLNTVQLVNQTKEKIATLAEKLPSTVKECMTKKLFLVHHPHGNEKVLSYGDYVAVRYALKPGTEGGVTLVKINNSQLGATADGDIRKVLLYAADTCPGSCGAPVLTFRRYRSGTGQLVYKMETWVHNGLDTIYSLSASLLKEFTSEDRDQILNPVLQQGLTTPDEEDKDNPGNQEVVSPVFKVTCHPCYPAYVLYKKRLMSYDTWPAHHIHEPNLLAKAGFFYAGNSRIVHKEDSATSSLMMFNNQIFSCNACPSLFLC